MRLLVTGATGFVGSAVAREALDAGHAVAGLSRTGRATVDGVVPLCGSVARPPWSDIEAFGPDVLVHLAWVTTPGSYAEAPENDTWVDWSTALIAESLGRDIAHVVVAGTCFEYAPSAEPLSERRSDVRPATRYGRAKDRLHAAAAAQVADAGGRFAWGRIFYAYGAGEPPGKLCSSLVRGLSAGDPVVLQQPSSTKDYIHVDDLARAVVLTIERGVTGPINWGSGTATTVGEIAGLVAEIVGRPDLVHPAATETHSDPVVADVTRLRELGWAPDVSLPTGLRRLHEALAS